MRQRIVDVLAEMDGQPARQWLIGWLHRHEWDVAHTAKRLGVSVGTVNNAMRALDIPTLENYRAVFYRGRWDSIGGHASRVGLTRSTAVRRYNAGCPLHVVFRPTNRAPRGTPVQDAIMRDRKLIQVLLDNPAHTLETLKPYLSA